jgi:PAS domain S-box-containing protein
MTSSDQNEIERRVVLLAPTGKDAALAQSVLGKAGIPTVACRDTQSLCQAASLGAGCVLVAEEALTLQTRAALAEFVSHQAPWSDLPMLVLTHPGASSATVEAVLGPLGNITLLERPVRVAALLSAVHTALRARKRQYELRDGFESRALLAAIVSSSDDAIISKTLDGIILSWNASAERMFGYSAAEAVGRSIRMIIPPDRQDEENSILERLRRGESIDHFDTVRITKDGKLIDISLTISPIRDATNRIIGASKVARDISAQKRAEQVLRDADRRKDEFLATLAHELRNPLAPISNSLHILRLADSSDPTVERVGEMMERQVNHMVRLVDDLLEVSRITRGKIDLRRERVELAAIIRNAVETSQPLIDSAGHQLALAVPTEPLTLDADPVRLAQVFANLLNNAAKYSDKPGQIWLTARRDADAVVVSVRDTGIGMPADKLTRVFDLFMQLDNSQRRSQGGLGIGLTLVRTLVQLHQGSVTAFSEGPGKGSEFVVRLPLADGVPVDNVQPRTSPCIGVPARVLIADDNRDAADSLGTLLKHLGAEVHVVHDGPAALEALEGFAPTLVLLDIGMPGMDGYEVARRIRQLPAFRHLKLIALTGWGQESDRHDSQAAGFDYHLTKPTNIAALQSLVVSVESDHRLTQR